MKVMALADLESVDEGKIAMGTVGTVKQHGHVLCRKETPRKSKTRPITDRFFVGKISVEWKGVYGFSVYSTDNIAIHCV